MHLYYYQDPETSRRVYTLQKFVDGKATKSAHPARFSPDDKYSRHRVTLKRRFGLLLTQQVSLYIWWEDETDADMQMQENANEQK